LNVQQQTYDALEEILRTFSFLITIKWRLYTRQQ